MRFPLDVISEAVPKQENEYQNVPEFVSNLQDNLRSTHAFVRTQLSRTAERQNRQYDMGIKVFTYKKGQLVWRNQKRNIPCRKAKVARHWTRPWIITEKLSVFFQDPV